MAENKFTGMLHAYTLGCLSTADYTSLFGYLENNGEYPHQDLGEFQNLVALLPSVLVYEAPPKSVKENIARRLYYIKDQVKEKKEKAAESKLPESKDYGNKFPGETDYQPEEKIPYLVPEPELVENVEEQETKYEDEAVHEEKEIEVTEPQIVDNESKLGTQENILSGEQAAETPVKENETAAAENEIISKLPEAVIEKPASVSSTKAEEVGRELEKESIIETKKEENKPLRSLGDFLAGAEVKPEEITGKIEFEDYFAEARKAEIKKRQIVHDKAPRQETALPKKDKLLRESTRSSYSERKYRGGGSSAGKIFIFLLILAIAGGMYYYFNSELDIFISDNKKISEELTSLKEISASDKDVLKILGMKDSRTFSLSGGTFNSYSYGKVIYSPEENRGYIHAGSLPELKENMSYQFWVSIGGRNFMVHKFTSSRVQEYYPFSLQRVNLNQYFRVFLTEEPSVGSQTPSRNILLSGSN